MAIPAEPEEGNKKNIYAKLLKVMGSLGWVEKRGENKTQNYKYVMADDVADKVRAELGKIGVAVTSDVFNTSESFLETKDKKIRIIHVDVLWTFADVATGEAISVTCPGEAMDSGDKAIYKAMTGSLKYAMKMNFLLPTGEDPEEESELDREVYNSPGKAPGAAASSKQQAAGKSPSSAPAASAARSGTQPFKIPFGKHNGKTLDDASVAMDYLEWLQTKFEESVAKKDEKYHERNVAQLKAVQDEIARRIGNANAEDAKEILEGEPGSQEVPF